MRIITRLNVGGPSFQAIHLTQRLQGSGFECALLVGDVGPAEGSMEPMAAARGVAFQRVPGLGREISPLSDGATVLRLYREMRRWQPDIVHTHLAKAGAVGRVAARMAGVPVCIHTYHGHVFHSYFSRRRTDVFLRIERRLARWTDRIVVLSRSQEQEIVGFGVARPERISCIPLGLELDPFLGAARYRGRLRHELGIRAETPLVGIVARLVAIKSHSLFLEAAAKVSRRMPETRFLIIGDGGLRAALESQARALGFQVCSWDAKHKEVSPTGSRPIVYFLGFRSDLPAIYADLDVVALCSRNEGLPVSIIEALAAERPVVATDVGAVRDLIAPGVTGELVPSGDPDGIARGILALLENRERAGAMAKAGRERVYPHLTLDRLEQDIRRLYTGLRTGEA
jgi:glycosyltransferase involved in cell wall biosynthesis